MKFVFFFLLGFFASFFLLGAYVARVSVLDVGLIASLLGGWTFLLFGGAGGTGPA